jgi:hypothetical protein
MQTLLELIANDVVLTDAFSCYSATETENYLRTFQSFRLQLTTQAISDRSVVLATAHFLQLHSLISRNMQATSSRQVTQGKTIEPISPNLIISRYGLNHWYLSSFGIEYYQLSQTGNEYSTLAIGI